MSLASLNAGANTGRLDTILYRLDPNTGRVARYPSGQIRSTSETINGLPNFTGDNTHLWTADDAGIWLNVNIHGDNYLLTVCNSLPENDQGRGTYAKNPLISAIDRLADRLAIRIPGASQ